MVLSQAWVLPWALGAAAALAVLVFLLGRRARPSQPVQLANTDVLTELPDYAHSLWRHRLLAVGYAAAATVVVVLAGLTAARPVRTTVLTPEKANRDIVLCLDVSGSMLAADLEVLATFRELAADFKGERIALVIFNSTAVPVFPLTDDYDFVDEQLRDALGAIRRFDRVWMAGTMNGPSSSLIADGLATCVRSFDHADAKRARSVVLATDNYAMGTSIFTMTEAGALANASGIQVYGLNPVHEAKDSRSVEMRTVCESTGGLYYPLESTDAVSRIVSAVNTREAGRIAAAPITIVHDEPSGLIGWTSLGALGLLVLVRRWRR